MKCKDDKTGAFIGGLCTAIIIGCCLKPCIKEVAEIDCLCPLERRKKKNPCKECYYKRYHKDDCF